MSQNRWTEARELLLALWKRAETYDVAASLGEVEFELGHYDLAARYMTFALAHIPPKEKRETAERYQAALQSIKGQIGTVQISSNRSLVEVRVDGATVGLTPLADDLYLSPGAHKIGGHVEGNALEKTLTVEAGKTYNLALNLSPPHASPSTQPASVSTNPPQTEPRSRRPPPSDKHSDAGLGAKTMVLIGGTAVTAVLIGLGVTGALRAQTAQDNADRLHSQVTTELGHNCSRGSTTETCASLASELDRRNSSNRLEGYSFAGAGLVAAATAAIYFLLPDKETSAPKHGSSVTLSVAPQSTSIGLEGSF
jgi:hypothetical protein